LKAHRKIYVREVRRDRAQGTRGNENDCDVTVVGGSLVWIAAKVKVFKGRSEKGEKDFEKLLIRFLGVEIDSEKKGSQLGKKVQSEIEIEDC
jgi:hypothetical protein